MTAASEDVSGRDERTPLPAQTKNDREGWQGGFPLGYKDAFSQWWAGVTPAQTEYRVLSFVPYIQRPSLESLVQSDSKASSKNAILSTKSESSLSSATSDASADPFGTRKWYTRMIKLSGKDRALHEFTVERVGEEVKNDVVILHGYGAGLGFFYKNFEPLSRLPGWRLHALDLLGMGRSSRPPFKIHAKDHVGKIREAEDWFIDALEEWRIESKIDKFTLLGHSLGGYMATAYALKYPGRLKKLVLISPVGIPEDPNAVNADLPEPVDSTLQNEFTQNQEQIVDPNKDSKTPRKPLPKWFAYLWDANISPFSVVRFSGPLGPSLISKWTTRRFSHLPPNEGAALHDYSYSLFRQAGSGEYALAYILAPGAFARSPLIRRISGLGRQPLPASGTSTLGSVNATSNAKLENGLPVVLMYGQQDWMDVSGGRDAVIKMLEEKEKVLKGKTSEERRLDRGSAKVVVIKNAGHHLYLDGPDDFNDVVLKELKDVEASEAAFSK